jgi:hypothetical protein
MIGGKALKQTKTERKTTEQFYDIQSRLLPKLKEIFDCEIYVLKFYHSKPDHGDMDILIKINTEFKFIQNSIREEIQNNLHPNQIVVNDGTTTFDFEEFQIDLIPVQEDVWESTKFWMDYDPSSNLCGKLYHFFGLKFGPESLRYPYRGEGGRVMKDIVITKDFRKMMEFLGLDPERKYQGFETLEEIYDWIISSKYYNTELFLLKNLTQYDRKRNKKRPTFNKFLEYVKDIPYETTGYHFEKNKTKYLDLIDKSFPEVRFLDQINELKKKDEDNMKLKSKFSGQLVMEWTGLEGIELGNVLKAFKLHHTDEWIRHYNSDAIQEKFMLWYEDDYKRYFLRKNQ